MKAVVFYESADDLAENTSCAPASLPRCHQ